MRVIKKGTVALGVLSRNDSRALECHTMCGEDWRRKALTRDQASLLALMKDQALKCAKKWKMQSVVIQCGEREGGYALDTMEVDKK